jgi:hypothetical protein
LFVILFLIFIFLRKIMFNEEINAPSSALVWGKKEQPPPPKERINTKKVKE